MGPMVRTLIIVGILALLIVGGVFAWQPLTGYWRQRSRWPVREAAITRGDIVSVVNATGNVKPVLQVSVGAFVSGPIIELDCEFNQDVKKGQILAKIDPRLYQANVDRDTAQYENRKADVDRVRALLDQAIRDEKRGILLRQENAEFISQADTDKLHFNRKGLEATWKVAQTAVKQAEAQLENSKASLEYTIIRAPVDGIVINRKIDPGQTVASQFQTPELFIVAPDMRKKMHVHASVDEADIGLIKAAQSQGKEVQFTVDAYPDTLFKGRIEEIRLNSTTTQNVVTYPVVVSAENSDLKLLPGMTASISFVVDDRKNVVKVPNAALRFFPPADQVRPEDKPLVEGLAVQAEEDNDSATQLRMSAGEKTSRRVAQSHRHVWVQGETGLRAVPIVVGLSDSRYSELLEGDVKEGDKLVTGFQQTGFGGPR